MKVILLEDVKSVGKKGEIVEVSTGYARNFILPKNKGVEATPKNINDWKLKKQHADKVAAENLAAAQELAAKLKDKKVTTTMKVGENGKTFGSVSAKEVAELLKKQLNLDIDKKKVLLPEPVKGLGGYKVGLKLHPEVTAEILLDVIAE